MTVGTRRACIFETLPQHSDQSERDWYISYSCTIWRSGRQIFAFIMHHNRDCSLLVAALRPRFSSKLSSKGYNSLFQSPIASHQDKYDIHSCFLWTNITLPMLLFSITAFYIISIPSFCYFFAFFLYYVLLIPLSTFPSLSFSLLHRVFWAVQADRI
jgi:hypothetical protein